MTLSAQATSAAPTSQLPISPLDSSAYPVRTDLKLPHQLRQRVFIELVQKLGLECLALGLEPTNASNARPRAFGLVLNRVQSAHPQPAGEDALLHIKEHGFNLTLTEFVDLCVRYFRLDAGMALTMVNYSQSHFTLAEFVRLMGSYELDPLTLLSMLPGEYVQALAPCFRLMGVSDADLEAAMAPATHGD